SLVYLLAVGNVTIITRRFFNLSASMIGAASIANRSWVFASSLSWLTWSRYSWFCLLIPLTWSCSVSTAGPLSAAVPTTRPIASARKTAVSETTWYRKLITGWQTLRSRKDREH